MEDEKKEQNADTQTATENKAQANQEQIAQKGEDGSIVFKNQDELDGFIRRVEL